MRARPLAMVLSILSLGGCGGDGSGPSDAFPDVEGSYSVFATFDGLTPTQGSATGTVTINQGSRSVGTLSGTLTLVVTINGDLFQLTSALSSASVTPASVLTFTGGEQGISWVFSGAMVNNALSGRHTLSDGPDVISGNWSGTRGATTAHFSAGATPPDLRAALGALVRR